MIEEHRTPDVQSPAITYRRGAITDSRTVAAVFTETLQDLSERLNVTAITGGQDPEVIAKLWERRRPLFEHLANTAHEFWLAESQGEVIGYARAILRQDVWELTEFFVLPRFQSAGVGRNLLEHVLPDRSVQHKVIIATADMRAQARYLKAGVYARFPITYFFREPQTVAVPTDLTIVPFSTVPDPLAAVRQIDKQVLGHCHDEDHTWLMGQRAGHLFLREGMIVGYGYTGRETGPFALLEESDFPAVLAHAESHQAGNSQKFGFEVPLINRAAVDYLLSRGYQIDSFYTLFMSDEPFGHFDRYLFPSPPFFI